MMRERIIEHIRKEYKADPEYLWSRFPDYAVFRHADNNKWFAILMNVRRDRIGLEGDGSTDIINVKLSDPLFADFLSRQPGYRRGYHFSRGSWVSILLDGSVSFEEICRWLEESYQTTASKEKKKKIRPPKEWIIPANPKYYDIEQAFENADEIEWKQGAGIKKGDTVYVYVAAPVSAILFKCRVTETDIPFSYDNGKVRMKALMKIRLQKRYERDRFTFDRLGREYGIRAVRGPRGIPNSLREALNRQNSVYSAESRKA